MSVLTINLETGMPTVETAKQRMNQGLRSARSQRIVAVKFIHGYGSNGRGGAIKAEIHRQLGALKRSGSIKEVVKGEEFSPFEPNARHAIDLCPELMRDRDYSRCNHGITVVIL
ncbi:hypothetical protein V6615_13785 [Oscillospiraceae bacterium PP1C4]